MKTFLICTIAALLLTVFAVTNGYAAANPFGILSTAIVYLILVYFPVLVVQLIVRTVRRSRDPQRSTR